MTKRLRLRPRAIEDLEEIARWTITEWNEEQAQRYLQGLKERFQSLADLPAQGILVAAEARIRRALYERHLILYRQIEGGVEIGRIIHDSRSFARDLERYRAWAANHS